MMSAQPKGGNSTRDQVTCGTVSPSIPRKLRVSLRLDAEVLEWFRGQVREHGGGYYQSMINAALQQYIFAQGKTLVECAGREWRTLSTPILAVV
jgi:uncharacterized protein (DUF4415 family)